MKILFSHSSAKIWKPGTFRFKFKDFYLLHQTLQLDKLGGVDCKYDNSFQRSSPKTQIELFWSPIFFFILDESL